MDKEIGKAVAREMLSLLRGTKAFVLEQAPDIMRQVLAWQAAEAAIYLATAIVLFALLPRTYRAAKKGWSEQYDSSGESGVMAVCASTAILVMGFVAVLCAHESIFTLVKIHYAPKVFLIEYFARLVR